MSSEESRKTLGQSTIEAIRVIGVALLMSMFGALGIVLMTTIVSEINRTGNYWLMLGLPAVLLIVAAPLSLLNRMKTEDEFNDG